MCSARQKTNTCFWQIRKIRKYSSYFPNVLHIELATLWPAYLHLEAVNGIVFVSVCRVPGWEEKVKLAKDCLAFSQVQYKSETMGRALILLPLSGWRKWDSLIGSPSSCPSWAFCCCLRENAVFFWGSCLKWSVFKEWASALLPRSGWASCCCSENRQIHTLVDLKAEKVTVNTGTFLLSSLINHSMGFTSPVS